MHVVLRVFGGIPGDLRTLIKHVGVLIIFFMPRKQLTEFEKGKIVAWSEEGVSNKEIGRRLKRTHHTIGRFLKLFKETGSHKRRTGGGRKRKTTLRQDRFIERQVLKRRRITSGNRFFPPVDTCVGFERSESCFFNSQKFLF